MRVAVLMGGISREREVSLASGDGVASALERKGWDVARVVVDDEECGALARARAQVAFIALHGRFGEDGGVQRRCEALGLPYTGSGPEASFRALEKTVAKRWFAAVGVPTPPWRRIEPPLCAERAAALVREGPGFPCVVKPVSEGSSIGVSIVEGEEALGPALEEVARLEGGSGPALVERFIAGREFTVGIVGESALPPVELIPKRRFYDYRAKYDASSGTEYVVDPKLEPGLRKSLLALALGAHRALGCEGVSRVDFRVDHDGHPFVLEVNTIPGMTPRSLLPKAAAAVGMDYSSLCEFLIRDALVRAARRGKAVA